MKKAEIFKNGVWFNHPIFRQILGMCPTLAVTTSAVNGLSMGLAVLFVLVASSAVVSTIKKIVPPQVRIAVYTVIIATFVTVVDIFFKANFPQISKALGPYVPLIIVNCIILGRCEAFASKNSFSSSLWDAFSMGLGFSWGLVVLASIREMFGAGTVFGLRVFPAVYKPLVIMILPAGAFLVLGSLIALINFIESRRK